MAPVEILDKALQAQTNYGTDAAIDVLTEHIDKMLRGKQFSTVSELFKLAQPDVLGKALSVSLLMVTTPARSFVSRRAQFKDRLITWLVQQGEREEEVDDLLTPLG